MQWLALPLSPIIVRIAGWNLLTKPHRRHRTRGKMDGVIRTRKTTNEMRLCCVIHIQTMWYHIHSDSEKVICAPDFVPFIRTRAYNSLTHNETNTYDYSFSFTTKLYQTGDAWSTQYLGDGRSAHMVAKWWTNILFVFISFFRSLNRSSGKIKIIKNIFGKKIRWIKVLSFRWHRLYYTSANRMASTMFLSARARDWELQ